MDNTNIENIVIDSFLRGKIKVYQYDGGYKSGSDAILLASIVAAKGGQRVLDVGCGVGVVSLAIAQRIQDIEVIGIEKQTEFYDLAKKNKELNNFKNTKVDFINDNILNYKNIEDRDKYDVICCNPPYYRDNHSNIALRDVANIEMDAKLEDFINFIFKALKNHGVFYMINRSERLGETLSLLPMKHWGNIEIFPIYSYLNQEAKRFIIKAKKIGKNHSKLHYGIVLHNEDGSYTKGAKQIFEEGRAFLDLDK